jgi:hypothetical protein
MSNTSFEFFRVLYGINEISEEFRSYLGADQIQVGAYSLLKNLFIFISQNLNTEFKEVVDKNLLFESTLEIDRDLSLDNFNKLIDAFLKDSLSKMKIEKYIKIENVSLRDVTFHLIRNNFRIKNLDRIGWPFDITLALKRGKLYLTLSITEIFTDGLIRNYDVTEFNDNFTIPDGVHAEFGNDFGMRRWNIITKDLNLIQSIYNFHDSFLTLIKGIQEDNFELKHLNSLAKDKKLKEIIFCDDAENYIYGSYGKLNKNSGIFSLLYLVKQRIVCVCDNTKQFTDLGQDEFEHRIYELTKDFNKNQYLVHCYEPGITFGPTILISECVNTKDQLDFFRNNLYESRYEHMPDFNKVKKYESWKLTFIGRHMLHEWDSYDTIKAIFDSNFMHPSEFTEHYCDYTEDDQGKLIQKWKTECFEKFEGSHEILNELDFWPIDVQQSESTEDHLSSPVDNDDGSVNSDHNEIDDEEKVSDYLNVGIDLTELKELYSKIERLMKKTTGHDVKINFKDEISMMSSLKLFIKFQRVDFIIEKEEYESIYTRLLKERYEEIYEQLVEEIKDMYEVPSDFGDNHDNFFYPPDFSDEEQEWLPEVPDEIPEFEVERSTSESVTENHLKENNSQLESSINLDELSEGLQKLQSDDSIPEEYEIKLNVIGDGYCLSYCTFIIIKLFKLDMNITLNDIKEEIGDWGCYADMFEILYRSNAFVEMYDKDTNRHNNVIDEDLQILDVILMLDHSHFYLKFKDEYLIDTLARQLSEKDLEIYNSIIVDNLEIYHDILHDNDNCLSKILNKNSVSSLYELYDKLGHDFTLHVSIEFRHISVNSFLGSSEVPLGWIIYMYADVDFKNPDIEDIDQEDVFNSETEYLSLEDEFYQELLNNFHDIQDYEIFLELREKHKKNLLHDDRSSSIMEFLTVFFSKINQLSNQEFNSESKIKSLYNECLGLILKNCSVFSRESKMKFISEFLLDSDSISLDEFAEIKIEDYEENSENYTLPDLNLSRFFPKIDSEKLEEFYKKLDLEFDYDNDESAEQFTFVLDTNFFIKYINIINETSFYLKFGIHESVLREFKRIKGNFHIGLLLKFLSRNEFVIFGNDYIGDSQIEKNINRTNILITDDIEFLKKTSPNSIRSQKFFSHMVSMIFPFSSELSYSWLFYISKNNFIEFRSEFYIKRMRDNFLERCLGVYDDVPDDDIIGNIPIATIIPENVLTPNSIEFMNIDHKIPQNELNIEQYFEKIMTYEDFSFIHRDDLKKIKFDVKDYIKIAIEDQIKKHNDYLKRNFEEARFVDGKNLYFSELKPDNNFPRPKFTEIGIIKMIADGMFNDIFSICNSRLIQTPERLTRRTSLPNYGRKFKKDKLESLQKDHFDNELRYYFNPGEESWEINLEYSESNLEIYGESNLCNKLKNFSNVSYEIQELKDNSAIFTHIIEESMNLKYLRDDRDVIISDAGFKNRAFLLHKGSPANTTNKIVKFRMIFFSDGDKNFSPEFSRDSLMISRCYNMDMEKCIYRSRLYPTLSVIKHLCDPEDFYRYYWLMFFGGSATKSMLSFFKYFNMVQHANFSKLPNLLKKYFSVIPKRGSDIYLAQKVNKILKNVFYYNQQDSLLGIKNDTREALESNNLYSAPYSMVTSIGHNYQGFYYDIISNINMKKTHCNLDTFNEDFDDLKHINPLMIKESLLIYKKQLFTSKLKETEFYQFCQDEFHNYFFTNTNGVNPFNLLKQKNALIFNHVLHEYYQTSLMTEASEFNIFDFLEWCHEEASRRKPKSMISIKYQKDASDREIVIQDFFSKASHFYIQMFFKKLCLDWPEELVTKSEYQKLKEISNMNFDENSIFINDDMKKWSPQDLKEKFFVILDYMFQLDMIEENIFFLVKKSMNTTRDLFLIFDQRLKDRNVKFHDRNDLISGDFLKKTPSSIPTKGSYSVVLMSHGWPQGIYHFISTFTHGLCCLMEKKFFSLIKEIKSSTLLFHSDDKNISVQLDKNSISDNELRKDIATKVLKINSAIPRAFSLAQSDTKPSCVYTGSELDPRNRKMSEMVSIYNIEGNLMNSYLRQSCTIFSSLTHKSFVENHNEVISRVTNMFSLSNSLMIPEMIYSELIKYLKDYYNYDERLTSNIIQWGGLKGISISELTLLGIKGDNYFKYKNNKGKVYHQLNNPLTPTEISVISKNLKKFKSEINLQEMLLEASRKDHGDRAGDYLRIRRKIMISNNSGLFLDKKNASFYNFYRHRNEANMKIWKDSKKFREKKKGEEFEETKHFNYTITLKEIMNLVETNINPLLDESVIGNVDFKQKCDELLFLSNYELTKKNKKDDLSGYIYRSEMIFGGSFNTDFSDALLVIQYKESLLKFIDWPKKYNQVVRDLNDFREKYKIYTIREFHNARILWDYEKKINSIRKPILSMWKGNLDYSDFKIVKRHMTLEDVEYMKQIDFNENVRITYNKKRLTPALLARRIRDFISCEMNRLAIEFYENKPRKIPHEGYFKKIEDTDFKFLRYLEEEVHDNLTNLVGTYQMRNILSYLTHLEVRYKNEDLVQIYHDSDEDFLIFALISNGKQIGKIFQQGNTYAHEEILSEFQIRPFLKKNEGSIFNPNLREIGRKMYSNINFERHTIRSLYFELIKGKLMITFEWMHDNQRKTRRQPYMFDLNAFERNSNKLLFNKQYYDVKQYINYIQKEINSVKLIRNTQCEREFELIPKITLSVPKFNYENLGRFNKYDLKLCDNIRCPNCTGNDKLPIFCRNSLSIVNLDKRTTEIIEQEFSKTFLNEIPKTSSLILKKIDLKKKKKELISDNKKNKIKTNYLIYNMLSDTVPLSDYFEILNVVLGKIPLSNYLIFLNALTMTRILTTVNDSFTRLIMLTDKHSGSNITEKNLRPERTSLNCSFFSTECHNIVMNNITDDDEFDHLIRLDDFKGTSVESVVKYLEDDSYIDNYVIKTMFDNLTTSAFNKNEIKIYDKLSKKSIMIDMKLIDMIFDPNSDKILTRAQIKKQGENLFFNKQESDKILELFKKYNCAFSKCSVRESQFENRDKFIALVHPRHPIIVFRYSFELMMNFRDEYPPEYKSMRTVDFKTALAEFQENDARVYYEMFIKDAEFVDLNIPLNSELDYAERRYIEMQSMSVEESEKLTSSLIVQRNNEDFYIGTLREVQIGNERFISNLHDLDLSHLKPYDKNIVEINRENDVAQECKKIELEINQLDKQIEDINNSSIKIDDELLKFTETVAKHSIMIKFYIINNYTSQNSKEMKDNLSVLIERDFQVSSKRQSEEKTGVFSINHYRNENLNFLRKSNFCSFNLHGLNQEELSMLNSLSNFIDDNKKNIDDYLLINTLRIALSFLLKNKSRNILTEKNFSESLNGNIEESLENPLSTIRHFERALKMLVRINYEREEFVKLIEKVLTRLKLNPLFDSSDF